MIKSLFLLGTSREYDSYFGSIFKTICVCSYYLGIRAFGAIYCLAPASVEGGEGILVTNCIR